MACLCLKIHPSLDRNFESLPSEYLQVTAHDHDSSSSSDSDFEFHPCSHTFMTNAHDDDLETMSTSAMPAMWSPMNATGYETSLQTHVHRIRHDIYQESDLIHSFPDSPPYISPLGSSNNSSDGACSNHSRFHPRRFMSDALDMPSSLKITKSKKFIFRRTSVKSSSREGEDLQPSPFWVSSCGIQSRIQVLVPLSSSSSSSSSLSKQTRTLSSATIKCMTPFRARQQSATSSSNSHTEQGTQFSKRSTTNIQTQIREPAEKVNINRKQEKMRKGTQGVLALGRTRVCGSNLMPEKSLVTDSPEKKRILKRKKRTSQRVSAEHRYRGAEGSGAEWNTLQHCYGRHYGHHSGVPWQELARSRPFLPYGHYI